MTSASEQQLLPPQRRRSRVWLWLGLMVLVAVVFAAATLLRPPPPPIGPRHPAVGTKLTTFHLEPLTGEGRETSLEDLAGKVTLLNFWGPWCSACIVEFPHLVEIERHFRGRGDFQFFSVSSNQNARDETGLAASTAQFLKQHQADFPTYRDADARTIDSLITDAKLDHFGFPTTVLLGRDGAIRGIWLGYSRGDEESVRQAIEKALADEPPGRR
jgi:thiol-disulfide isomerase/thioredoxin